MSDIKKTKDTGLLELLIRIQNELKAPKDLINSFGKYKYRNVESILEALKPLLLENKCLVTLSDSVVNVGDRYYIESTATISQKDESITTKAYARESFDKKGMGMDEAQITGGASSYARKYALCGLFLIDGEDDADKTNNHQPKVMISKELSFEIDATWKQLYSLMQAKNTELTEEKRSSYFVSTLKKYTEKVNIDSLTELEAKKFLEICKKQIETLSA